MIKCHVICNKLSKSSTQLWQTVLKHTHMSHTLLSVKHIQHKSGDLFNLSMHRSIHWCCCCFTTTLHHHCSCLNRASNQPKSTPASTCRLKCPPERGGVRLSSLQIPLWAGLNVTAWTPNLAQTLNSHIYTTVPCEWAGWNENLTGWR